MAKKERLDKVLANMGYGSRKDVKKFIKDGRVKVNNSIICNNEFKVNPYEDEIFLGEEEVLYREYIYLMMNKPQGLVSSTDDPRTKTVIDLLSEEYLIYKPFPVGRLDKDTEGFLLISNDGKLAHELLSPKKGVNKKYYVEVDGYVEDKYIEVFKKGITLDDGYKTLPADLEIINGNIISKVYLTIQEGKFHQVKRMFESIGMKVLFLKRISMGPLVLDQLLDSGEYRELTKTEISLLKEL
ncbi:rRNA pseudouridine synthase [Tissierella pigra]|uniref:Pseudouridine synthase n=1 Tax=Tissierella pigra TaxID=2607614 RepID=A0A6N7XXK8_9FIRM|nr:pseudouridine synthase [Tissierella pigra]MBU5426358.1 rRNA pseudouridine synthase [Tissierella pigra]MSU02183.1 rRNA pseudouridine synthase [Tissierella pigra]